MKRGAVFSDDVEFDRRLVIDEDDLKKKLDALRALDQKIVLTSGSFDLSHIGHMRYLRAARLLGDVLVVGIDSDQKVRKRKGKYRPVWPDMERAEMVVHSRYADIVTIKGDEKEKWSLIKLVRPDILVISERVGYDEETQAELLQYCGSIENLPSQAESSTSAGVRRLQMETLAPNLAKIRRGVEDLNKALEEIERESGIGKDEQEESTA